MAALYLIVAIAGQRAAIAADLVRSVVEFEAITPVPLVPPHIAGLAALRSRVLTIVDCRRSLELGSGTVQGMMRAVVVEMDVHQYGLLVDEVEDVVLIETAPRDTPMALAAGWARAVAGTVEQDGVLLPLLDPAALVAGPAALAA